MKTFSRRGICQGIVSDRSVGMGSMGPMNYAKNEQHTSASSTGLSLGGCSVCVGFSVRLCPRNLKSKQFRVEGFLPPA